MIPEHESDSSQLHERVPQGLTSVQFDLLSRRLRAATGHLGDDIRVHGSRAAGSAGPNSDLDIAIRVSGERFQHIIDDPQLSTLARPRPSSSKMKTRNHAFAVGKLARGEIILSAVGEQLEQELEIPEVQISVIRIGSDFDRGPWIPLRREPAVEP